MCLVVTEHHAKQGKRKHLWQTRDNIQALRIAPEQHILFKRITCVTQRKTERMRWVTQHAKENIWSTS